MGEGGGQEMEAMVEKDTELHVVEPGIVYCYILVG